MITREQARGSLKNLQSDIFSLNPSSLITLFTLDLSDLVFNAGLVDIINSDNENDRIFRFHNNLNLTRNDLIWQGKTYYPAPIQADGFEISSRSVLPTPRLALSVNDNAISVFTLFKDKLNALGDLAGAKITRIRTLARFLDRENFPNNNNPSADPNSEFPRDIYYIDRKSAENKNFIEWELSSILDVNGVSLPFRRVIALSCSADFRGESCGYEFAANRVTKVHGTMALPSAAPPVADKNDQKFTDLLPNTNFVNKGAWKKNTLYNAGDYCYIEKDSIKYYFLAKQSVPINISPPNDLYFYRDECSKRISGCKCRWGTNSPGQLNGNPFNSSLPFLGYPAVNKAR